MLIALKWWKKTFGHVAPNIAAKKFDQETFIYGQLQAMYESDAKVKLQRQESSKWIRSAKSFGNY